MKDLMQIKKGEYGIEPFLRGTLLDSPYILNFSDVSNHTALPSA